MRVVTFGDLRGIAIDRHGRWRRLAGNVNVLDRFNVERPLRELKRAADIEHDDAVLHPLLGRSGVGVVVKSAAERADVGLAGGGVNGVGSRGDVVHTGVREPTPRGRRAGERAAVAFGAGEDRQLGGARRGEERYQQELKEQVAS